MKTTIQKATSCLASKLAVMLLAFGFAGGALGANVAKIGNTEYATLAEAFAQVQDGQTVQLIADTAAASIPAGKNITLDLNGKTITGQIYVNANATLVVNATNGGVIDNSAKAESYVAYAINAAGNLTINGGTFKGGANAAAVSVGGDSSTVTVNDGTFSGLYGLYVGEKVSSVRINDGTFTGKAAVEVATPSGATADGGVQIDIYGGSFTRTDSSYEVIGFNLNSSSSMLGTPKVTLYGGTYNKFQKRSSLATGYQQINNGNGTWTVKESLTEGEKALAVAKVGDYYFFTSADANDAGGLQNGETIELVRDSSDFALTLPDGATLEGNGHTLTGVTYVSVPSPRTGTIKNVKFKEATGTTNHAIIGAGGTLVVTGCEFDSCRPDNNTIEYNGTGDGSVTITGNVFTHSNPDKTPERYINVYGRKGADVNFTATIKDNIIKNANDGGTTIVPIRLKYFGATETLDIGGNYIEDPAAIAINDSTNLAAFDFAIYESLDSNGGIDPSSSVMYKASGEADPKQISKVSYVAQIGTTKYETLAAAITAAENGGTIHLLENVDMTDYFTTSSTRFPISKSLAIDGQGRSITVGGRGFGVGMNATSNIDVTFKDVTIVNTSYDARCIDTRGNLNSLTLDHVTLDTNGARGTTQPLTIGGSQADSATVTIRNGSKIQTNDDATAYYAIITFNPVNMTITDSTIKGWACIYAKGKNGSAGSAGSEFTITDSVLESSNIYNGNSNAFSAIMIEDNDVQVNITGTEINIYGNSDQKQAVVGYPDNNTFSESSVSLGEGNVVTLGGTNPNQSVVALNYSGSDPEDTRGGVSVSGGTFNKEVPEDVCADGYIPAEQDSETGMYTVKTGSYVAQNTTTGVKYETLQEAIAAAQDGDTITLLTDVTVSAYVDINKSITLDGDGHQLTVNATRGIRVTTGDVDVTVKNLVMPKTAKMERAIQVDSGKEDVSLTIDNVTATATVYTVNVCDDVVNLDLTIKASNLTGWGVVNLWGDNGTVVIEDSTLTGVNDKSFNADGWNNFGVIVVEGDTTGQTEDLASAYDITVNNTAIVVDSTTGNGQTAILYNNQSVNNGIVLENCTVELKNDNCSFMFDSGYANLTKLKGTTLLGTESIPVLPDGYCYEEDGDGYQVVTAAILQVVRGGVVVGTYGTLASAVDAAQDGDTVKLLDHVYLTQMYTVPNGKNITLDLAGYSISPVIGEWYGGDMLLCVAYGATLTIDDSSEDKSGRIDTSLSEDVLGAIKMTNKGDNPANGTSMLVVNGGTIVGTSYGISGNGTRSGTSVTINGGSISVTETEGIGIYQPQNGTLVITGDAYIEGATAVYVKSGSVSVSGDAFLCGRGLASEYSATGNGANSTGQALVIDNCGYPGGAPIATITGGSFLSYENTSDVGSYASGTGNKAIAGFISGGAFMGPVPEEYCATGYIPAENVSEGYYTVKPGEFVARNTATGQGYETLAAAIDAAVDGETVTLLKNCSGAGIIVPQGKFGTTGLTVDFNKFTYTVDGEPLAGSTGTKTQAFQLLKDNTITFKNGAIVANSAGVKMLIQNYSDLTLDGMTLDATRGGNSVNYVLSTNNGSTTIKDTTITAKANGIAFDVDSGWGNYEANSVEVVGNSVINGNVEVAFENKTPGTPSTLTLTFGTINGEIKVGTGFDKCTVTKADEFTQAAPSGYLWKDNGDGTSTLASAVAKIGDTCYASLEDAVNAAQDGETVTLLKNCSGAGIIVPQGKFGTTGLTVDFGGFTYTVDSEPLAGSTGTKTQAFQLLKDNTITFKNGTIVADSAGVKMLIQNYSNLTLDNMTLDATQGGNSVNYVLSTNNGSTTIKDTTIKAKANGIAFDACTGWGSYTSNSVTVTGASKITGDIEASFYGTGTGPVLTLSSGTHDGAIKVAQGFDDCTVNKSAAFVQTAPTGYVWKDNGNGTSTLASAVAKIGDAYYASLEDAVNAAQDGDTVTLLKNCSGAGIIVPQGKFTTGLTVDFGGFTYTVDSEPLAGSTGTKTQAFQLLKDNKITFKNGAIVADSAGVKMLIQNYSDLTLDGMTLDATRGGNSVNYVLSTNNGSTTIKDTTITAKTGGVAFDACTGWGSYTSNSVTVTGASKITGDIEASFYGSGTAPTLMLSGGTHDGAIKVGTGFDECMVTKADAFAQAAPAGYVWKDNGNGTSTLAMEIVEQVVYPVEGSANGLQMPNDWLAANSVAGYKLGDPLTASVTNKIVQALRENGENGVPLWQSYVLGLTPNGENANALRVSAGPVASDATKITVTGLNVNVPSTLDTNTTVTYRLAARNADGTWADIKAGEKNPSFEVSLDAVAGKVVTIFADIATK